MSEAVSKQPKRSRRGLILFAVIVLALIALVVVHLLTQKKPAFLFVNNRLEGNAPGTIEAVLERLLG